MMNAVGIDDSVRFNCFELPMVDRLKYINN